MHKSKLRKAGNLVVKEQSARLKYDEDEFIKECIAYSYWIVINSEVILKKTNTNKTKGTYKCYREKFTKRLVSCRFVTIHRSTGQKEMTLLS